MLRSIFWKPYSHLLIVGDNADWVIDEEAKELKKTMGILNIPSKRIKRVRFNVSQAVHYVSQFSLNEPSIYKSKNRISVDYFHGKPHQGENFRKCFESLKENHSKISRVRVSTTDMEDLIKTSGIDESKVIRIPIGINTEIFKPQTVETKKTSRKILGIPETSVVIGSFQKDGVGWGDGNKPKLIKGPDIFLKVIERLKADIPNLFVLLSGPSRGFVKTGLDKIRVPYKHIYMNHYKDISDLYDALDMYLITSREEGGPKACLEAMAKGVPLITTDVGQCKDLVINSVNAMMTSIENVDELHALSLKVLRDPALQKSLIKEGLITAKENSYKSQLPLWKEYFKNLINS